jgi:hypothetical protein
MDFAWIVLVAAMILVAGSTAWASSDSAPDAALERGVASGGGQFVVQIVGRFCEYQRRDVEAALGQLWNVRRVEFLNDHGTLRLFYDSQSRTRMEMARSVERALSLGWFCSAYVDPDAKADAPVRLIEMIR